MFHFMYSQNTCLVLHSIRIGIATTLSNKHHKNWHSHSIRQISFHVFSVYILFRTKKTEIADVVIVI